MTSVADRTRAAMDAITSQVDSAPPLPLPPPAVAGRRRRAPSPWRRWGLWLTPVAAAAAVIALAISLVLVRDIPNGGVVPPVRPAPAVGAVPRYYVVPVPRQQGVYWEYLVVGDTFTGARLATLQPPRGSSFAAVTAAADDRTFVVEAEPSFDPLSKGPPGLAPAKTWYLLRIAPGTASPTRLTRLAIPGLKGAGIYALALSGSGRELAVGVIPDFTNPWSSPMELRVYSVSTGKLERAWSTRDRTVFGGPGGSTGSLTTQLTWVDNDRAVAFSTRGMTAGHSKFERVTRETLRLLDMSSGGGDLMADSRVIWSSQAISSPTAESSQLSCANSGANPMISADGKTIVCAAAKGSRPGPGTSRRWTLAWLEYSTSAPAVARTVAELSVDVPRTTNPVIGLLWVGPAGSPLIGEWAGGSYPYPTPPPDGRPRVGVVSDGKFRQLPTPPAAVNLNVVW